MSFVRMGVDGSDVYIYDDVDWGPFCCGCALVGPTVVLDYPGRVVWGGYATTDLDAMLAHIAAHRAAGHHVPDWVDGVLRDEWDPPEGTA